MSPADNSSLVHTPISHSASARLASLARTSGALSSPYPSLAPIRRAMYHVPFVPRPFPPPALADVPLEYIIDQLRRLAPHYWSRPETSDCTIVVSLDHESPSDKTQASAGVCDAFRDMGISAEMSAESFGLEDASPSAAGQSPTRKSVRPRRMIMKLHMDYLCAHSALFRGLLSGASPFDLAMETPTDALPGLPHQSAASPPRFPCILPSSTCTHPVIHLPVPDPASFHHIIHYIYFGSTSFMEEALDNGDLTWDGLARNVEYLKMGDDIKLFLGRYWRRVHTYCDYNDSDSDHEYDSASDCDSDSDACMTEDESTLADPDEDRMCLADDEDEDEDVLLVKAKAQARARDPPRGRQRTARRLGHSLSDPGISYRASEAGPCPARRNVSK
ncbi:hypothetical protein DICSQDRAFT_98018 [Dichomitus squalens LYAD-421 SS1]|uniref:uncharacterized protein n=1 Tax=Dichomitus squalens (strain LYAD-421) TaxID=732165 RepID=UPI0004412D94|nr:uncharacterized protein DICSQDRAFT_98018 [Dichomitus squalens LYAD-421 SS1]EJF66153.1 hypothetical protein DICSQDRAFT_98018 [Dichomitus squalens LYAD-421 SS1]